jgi:hypothetical protein
LAGPCPSLSRTTALVLAIVLSVLVLFGVVIGLGAAAIGFAIGHLFHTVS